MRHNKINGILIFELKQYLNYITRIILFFKYKQMFVGQ